MSARLRWVLGRRSRGHRLLGRRFIGRWSFVGIALVALPAVGMAEEFVTPGLELGPRPSYREAYDHYPPTQHNALGMPVPPPDPYARPSYRESLQDFPPPAGRYGGGFVEYLMTGGRPEAPPPRVIVPAVPGPTVVPAPAAAYAVPGALPRSGLPDYAPQPPAYYGAGEPMAYSGAPPTAQGVALAPAGDPRLADRPSNPVYERQEVAYPGRERGGTIVIDTPNKFLYLVEGGGRAIRYGIGVGRPGFAWAGVKTITRKAQWPGWTPPRDMLARRPDLPRHMDGGEANPLGARALYLGSSLYRIHGTNEPSTIGMNVSSGCIRMMNADVIDLYGRVGVGTKVVVM